MHPRISFSSSSRSANCLSFAVFGGNDILIKVHKVFVRTGPPFCSRPYVLPTLYDIVGAATSRKTPSFAVAVESCCAGRNFSACRRICSRLHAVHAACQAVLQGEILRMLGMPRSAEAIERIQSSGLSTGCGFSVWAATFSAWVRSSWFPS